MDIGLYKMKHPFAKLIRWLIPMCRNVDPNVLSLALIPIGAAVAVVYYFAPEQPVLYLLGVTLIFLRMVVATLDGLVAVTYGKSSARGELINRMAPELADLMMLGAIVLSKPSYASLIVPVLLVGWATSFFGLIGLAAQRPIQSVGPCGQTDRLAALGVFSLLAYFGSVYAIEIDFIRLFLWWTLVGGTVTVIFRGYRSLRTP